MKDESIISTKEGAKRCKITPMKFRKLAKDIGVHSLKRNCWPIHDVARMSKMITKSGVKERGWTDSMIRRFADPCDEEAVNPHYRNAAPMRLYREVRIEAIEQTSDWQAALAKSLERRKAAAKATETKNASALFEDQTSEMGNTICWAKSVEIRVPVMAPDLLLQNAIEHFNLRSNFYGSYSFASEKSGSDFLNRIQVNFIRHELTSYESLLSEKFGLVGSEQAYVIIKQRTLDAIAETYPYLSDECVGQSSRVYDTTLSRA